MEQKEEEDREARRIQEEEELRSEMQKMSMEGYQERVR